jgi:hypothetical protein
MHCPVCNGFGKIKDPSEWGRTRRKKAVIVLRTAGFGIREIQRLVGYVSPRSVSLILKNYMSEG